MNRAGADHSASSAIIEEAALASSRCSMPSGGRRRQFAAMLQPRLDQGMVVVACDGHDLAPGERLAELLEERARGGQRLAAGAVAQLQQVAEQHQAIDVRQGLQQLCAQLGTPQQIHVRRVAEVEV